MDPKQIENNFKYHSTNKEAEKIRQSLAGNFMELAFTMDALCPDSREKSVAMTYLETALLWADASIARNE